MSPRRSRPSAVATRALVLASLVGAVLLAAAVPAGAHVDLEASNPADGTTVTGPVDEVILTFSTAMELVDDGVVLLDEQAEEVSATVSQPTDIEVVVTPEVSLEVGSWGVRWTAKSPDAHPRSGSFAFAVEASSVLASDAAGGQDADGVTPENGAVAAADSSGTSASALDAALTQPSTQTWDRAGWFARAVAFAAALFVVGAVAFMGYAQCGSVREGRWLIYLVRRAALLGVAATLLDVAVQAVLTQTGDAGALIDPAAYREVLSGANGIGIGIRVLALGGVLASAVPSMRPVRDDGRAFSADEERWETELATGDAVPDGPIGLASSDVVLALRESVGTRTPMRPAITSAPRLVVATALVVVSFSFLGHTAEATPRLVVAVADVVHVTAASVWVGGVWALSAVLWRRRRSHEPLSAAVPVLRFSVLASLGVVAAGVAGFVLAWLEMDSIPQLWSTSFGRVLLVKVLLMGLAAGVGVYNHRVVLPRLASGGRARRLAQPVIVRTLAIEGTVMAAVVVTTALLVGSGLD